MTLATTPCPPWCQTDHDQYRSHDQMIGVVGVVTVIAFQYGNEPPTVQVGKRGLEQWAEVAPSGAAGFAALMDLLGHADLAELVRRAAETIGGTQ